MSTKFFDKLAMMKLEQNYPNRVKRLDELRVKEKEETLTPEEKIELDKCDRVLLQEYRTCVMHYRLNWSLMSREAKQKLRDEVTEHFSESGEEKG